MRRVPVSTAGVLLLLLVTCAVAAGQEVPKRTPERGADLISVQFALVSPDGTPVADLRADEVTIRIGGGTRPVRSLQLISFAGTGAAEPSDVIVLPPPFGTNSSTTTGRTMVLAID